jgi:PAS domain S-box-containing protein
MEVTDLISKEELEDLLEGFSDLFGVVIVVTKPDGVPVTRYINFTEACDKYHRKSKIRYQKCVDSDAKLGREAAEKRKPVINLCGCGGFVDAAVPIIIENKHVATIFTGQIMFEEFDRNKYKEVAKELGIDDVAGYLKAVEKIKVVNKEDFERIVDLLDKFGNMIFLSAYEKYKNNKLVEYYHNIFYSLPVPTSLFDLEGKRIDTSYSVEVLFKRKHEEIINMEAFKLYDKEDLEKINKAINEAKKGRISHVETIANKGDGTTFPVLLSFSPVRNKDGGIINIIGTATDITDIKNREEEYKKVVEETTKAMEYISSGEYTIKIDTNYMQDDLKLLTETLNMVIEYLSKTDDDLKILIKELATPAIEVMKGVVVMPLVGMLTSDRALDAMDNILNKIEQTNAKVGIIDITGVPGIDSAVADNLIKSIESIKLIGAIPILSGIGAETAKNLVRIGIKFDFVTKSNLSEALEYAVNIIKQ